MNKYAKLLVLCLWTFVAARPQAAGAADPQTQGYPPLAAAYVTASAAQSNVLEDALKTFAQSEHLRLVEGGLNKQGPGTSVIFEGGRRCAGLHDFEFHGADSLPNHCLCRG
jgi:hypothetical protein